MDFFEVATSTPTMRHFLDRPIPEEELLKILETANMAPSGSNAQPWEFVVVRDAAARREIQKLYEAVWEPYKDSAIIRGRTTLSPRAVKALKTGDEFAAQLAIVPVHVVIFLDRPKMRVERGIDGGRTLRCERAARLFGLAQLFKKLLNGRLRFVGSTALYGQRIDAIIDRVDLLGDGLQVDLAGAHIVKSANDLVGDLFNDLTVDGRSCACLQLGLERA